MLYFLYYGVKVFRRDAHLVGVEVDLSLSCRVFYRQFYEFMEQYGAACQRFLVLYSVFANPFFAGAVYAKIDASQLHQHKFMLNLLVGGYEHVFYKVEPSFYNREALGLWLKVEVGVHESHNHVLDVYRCHAHKLVAEGEAQHPEVGTFAANRNRVRREQAQHLVLLQKNFAEVYLNLGKSLLAQDDVCVAADRWCADAKFFE